MTCRMATRAVAIRTSNCRNEIREVAGSAAMSTDVDPFTASGTNSLEEAIGQATTNRINRNECVHRTATLAERPSDLRGSVAAPAVSNQHETHLLRFIGDPRHDATGLAVPKICGLPMAKIADDIWR